MQNDHYEYEFRPRLAEFGKKINLLLNIDEYIFVKGYQSIYVKRTGDKSDGCCIFYKINRLRLIASKAVPFYQRNIQLLDR